MKTILSSYLFEKSYYKYNIFYDDATDHYVNALSQLEESYCWGLLSIASDFQLKFEEEL